MVNHVKSTRVQTVISSTSTICNLTHLLTLSHPLLSLLMKEYLTKRNVQSLKYKYKCIKTSSLSLLCNTFISEHKQIIKFALFVMCLKTGSGDTVISNIDPDDTWNHVFSLKCLIFAILANPSVKSYDEEAKLTWRHWSELPIFIFWFYIRLQWKSFARIYPTTTLLSPHIDCNMPCCGCWFLWSNTKCRGCLKKLQHLNQANKVCSTLNFKPCHLLKLHELWKLWILTWHEHMRNSR